MRVHERVRRGQEDHPDGYESVRTIQDSDIIRSAHSKLTCDSIDTFLGIGLDGEGRVVLYCNGVYGEWNQCTKNGAKTDCPPIGK